MCGARRIPENNSESSLQRERGGARDDATHARHDSSVKASPHAHLSMRVVRGFNVFERASALPERGAALLVGRHVPSLRPLFVDRRSLLLLSVSVSSVRFEEN